MVHEVGYWTDKHLMWAYNIRCRYLAGDDEDEHSDDSDDGSNDEDDDEDQSGDQSNHKGDDDDDDDFDEDSYHQQVKEIQKTAIYRFAELKR